MADWRDMMTAATARLRARTVPASPLRGAPDLPAALRTGAEWLRRASALGSARPEALMDALKARLPSGGAMPGAARPRPARTAPGRFEAHAHTGPAGSRPYHLYVPQNLPPGPRPLVLMLHGCTQDPEDFAAGTGMNLHAEEHGVLVAYPAQTRAANCQRCWNWFNRADQERGRGEPAILAALVAELSASHPVDPARVYAAGLSAGAAAAAVLGQAYPDVFAAVGVHSGLPAGAAADTSSALAAMRNGVGSAPRGGPPAIVFHGDADAVVNPRNGESLAAAASGPGWREDREDGQKPGGRAYSRTLHRDPSGRVRLEHWVVRGSGHAWSGGDPAGSYTDPEGPDASREMLRFFLERRLG